MNPIKIFWIIALAAVASFLILVGLMWQQVNAAGVCGRYTEMRDNLMTVFHEHSVGIGESGGVIIEMFEADKGATFTMLVINQQGVACIFAAGKNWEEPKAKKTDGAPS